MIDGWRCESVRGGNDPPWLTIGGEGLEERCFFSPITIGGYDWGYWGKARDFERGWRVFVVVILAVLTWKMGIFLLLPYLTPSRWNC